MVGVLVQEFSNGVMMPAVSLGCWDLKGDADSTPIAVKAALDEGYYALDDAQIYGNEHVIGPIVGSFTKDQMKAVAKFDPTQDGTPFKVVSEDKFLESFEKPHGKPEDDRAVFVTTKIWCTKFTPEGIRAQVEQHLKDFKRSSIDLLLLHVPGDHYLWAKDENSVHDPRNAETRIICWKTLEALYAEGKVRLIGVSNYMAKHLQPLIQDIEKRKAAGDKHARLPFVNQIEISAFCQVGDELEQLCKQNDIIFTSYSSLGSAKCVAEYMAHEVIQSTATKHKVTAANVLLRWCLQKGYMILPRSTKAERVKENYGPTMSFKLDQEDMEAISKLNTGRRALLDPHEIA